MMHGPQMDSRGVAVWLCGYVGRVLAERLRAAVCVGWLRAERIRPAGTVRPILGSDCTAEHRYECPSVQPAIHRCSNTFASDEQPITSSWNYRLRARMIWSYGARPSCTAEFGLSDALKQLTFHTHTICFIYSYRISGCLDLVESQVRGLLTGAIPSG
jgi:hypothetical protein